MELFTSRGFDATTVDEIAEAAGVSQRTVFRYFPTKRSILLEYDRTLSEKLRALLRGRPPRELTLRALEPTLIAFAEILQEDREKVALRMAIMGSSAELATYTLEALQTHRAVIAGELARHHPAATDESDRLVLTWVANGVLVVALSEWLDEDLRQHLPALTLRSIERVRAAATR
ncbi:hypothetical protein CcI49_28980 [Frankia sp. CcI49]|uniref:TetR family transcriptional regulator n=1 Tax=Frankia sp. CcI49 TaxID=1745382 RepID=UPI0009D4B5C0|nr:TetR family transcriptional regulator [Frankia sp. CcI49]ONH55541.1 hypothetical protein CcI49_28980 [Frankia sp. CcI49]